MPAKAAPKGKAKFKPESNPGALRLLSDKREITGLLIITGFCALVQPLYDVASLIGPNGTTVTFDENRIAFFLLVGGCCLITLGALSVLVGYLEFMMGIGHTKATIAGIVVAQTAFIPYITSMIAVGKQAQTGVGFIPEAYNPSASDVKFVGSMGILGIISYGFALVGAIAFMLFSLYAFQVEKPETRTGLYFKGRLRFYSIVLYIAGMSQLALGAYIFIRDDIFGLQLENGPVVVAFYVISKPILSGIVGLIQAVGGGWGFARTCYSCSPDNGKMFQGIMAASWLAQVFLQAITNGSLSEGATDAGNPATVVALSLALSLMPSYLDYKACQLPDEFEEEYYTEKANPKPKEPRESALSLRKSKLSQSMSAADSDSPSLDVFEKKQKALERSMIALARRQRDLEKSMKRDPDLLMMSDPELG